MVDQRIKEPTLTQIFGRVAVERRHRLVDRLDAVSHGELVDDLLGRVLEVDLPCIVADAFCVWQFDISWVAGRNRQKKESSLRRRERINRKTKLKKEKRHAL